MNKVQWLRTNWNQSFSSIVDSIAAHEYRQGGEYGFEITKKRRDRIEGTYYCRHENTITYTDPFGHEYSNAFINFDSIAFMLSDAPIGMELSNPPATTKPFFLLLSEYSSFKSSIARLNISLLSWIEEVEALTQSVIVSRLLYASIPLSSHTSISANIVGDEDVRQYLKKYPKGVAKKARLEFRIGNEVAIADISNRATALIIKGNKAAQDILKKALNQLTESKTNVN